MTRTAAPLLLLMLGACTVGPDWRAPTPFAPPAFLPHGTAATNDPVDPRWWRALNDPVLTGLVGRLWAGNLSVAAATARLAQLRALRTAAGGAQYPALDAAGGYERARLSRTGTLDLLPPGITRRARQPFDLFDAGFDASWELDLWGRVRRGMEAADSAITAGEDDRRAVLVTAEAELARLYIGLRRAQAVLALTAEAADVPAPTPLARAEAGMLRAQLPLLRAEVAETENAIALLLGAPPGALATELDAAVPTPPVPPGVPVGLPSALLRRRPDVRAAEARLHQATAGIGMAQAEFFPRIALSGSVGVSALRPAALGSLNAVGFAGGPSFSIPVFEGGRLRGQVELRRAEQQEAAVAFAAATLGAFHDVDNALVAYAAAAERRTALEHVVADARRAGNTPDARRLRFTARLALADATAALATAFVQLYKALGGGWEIEFPDPPPSSSSPR